MLCEGRETSGDFVGTREKREAIGGAETIQSALVEGEASDCTEHPCGSTLGKAREQS